MKIISLEQALENVNNIVDEYFEIRSDDSKIFKLHQLADDLSRNNLTLAIHYNLQENAYALSKISYQGNFNNRKMQLMDMPSFKGKKMSVAYATMVAEKEFFDFKKEYMLAESTKEGIKSIMFQVKDNIDGIRQRIASIKNNNV